MAIDSRPAPSEWDRAGQPPPETPDVDVDANADVVALGPFAERSFAWWGMVMAIVTEATLFALLLFVYVYLRVRADEWPPPGIEAPELLWTSLRSVLLVGSSVPVQLAEHAFVRGRRRAALGQLAGAWVMAAVFLAGHVVDVHRDWGRFRPSTNAYGSIFYLITNLHALHLVIGLAFLGFVFVRIVQGGVRPGRHDALTVSVLYWHFVDVVWIAVFSILYLAVSW
jgi:heme/copper-type cytochrome/quinol oxidase subunit 3